MNYERAIPAEMTRIEMRSNVNRDRLRRSHHLKYEASKSRTTLTQYNGLQAQSDYAVSKQISHLDR